MPTITFDFNDFLKLLGRKITEEQFGSLLLNYAKAELEHHDKNTGTVTVKLGDTNLPYLWSVEGLAILLKGVLGIEKGIPKIEVKRSDYKIVADRSVSRVRPYIAAFVAKGKKVDDYLLTQMVQFQEKLADNYGRKRQKISIGIYKSKNLKWPLHYKAVDPESIRFIPLESTKALNLKQILEQHPKGKAYAGILAPFDKYPIFVDNAGEVLSFPPIINSNTTGRVVPGDDELLIEVTGTDERATDLAANIFSQALYLRGFSLESITVDYGSKKKTTPTLNTENVKIRKEEVRDLLGISLNDGELKGLLEKARFGFSKSGVVVPHFRQDVLHPNDIMEDIGIMYGFGKIQAMPLKTYTTGGTRPIVEFLDKVREVCVGVGYQEVFSSILSNKDVLYKKMTMQDVGTVEIDNYMSESYAVIRTWLTPALVDMLSKNGHVTYPQKLFEQGLVSLRSGKGIHDVESLAMVSAHNEANYTELRQAIDYLMELLALGYDVEEHEHPSFISGRCSKIIVGGKMVAFIGEIHPRVLENFGISVPVAAAEMDLSKLFELSSK